MNTKLLFSLASIVCLAATGFTADEMWVVGAEGSQGDLVTVEFWFTYDSHFAGDQLSAFDCPIEFEADVCTVEAITIGTDFMNGIRDWTDASKIDNQGTQGPPAVPKIAISAFTLCPMCFYPVPRGTHHAATVGFRILESVVPPDSTCLDTLMQAFTPRVYLGFVDIEGYTTHIPSFSTDCIQVIDYYCGDANADRRISSADIVYLGNYIYRVGPEPYGQGDVNLDGRVTVADAIYLGHYIYRGGPEPCNP